MAPPGVEKTATKMKFATKEEHPEGASHHPEHHGEGGTHGHHEGKPHSPVLIEHPGTTESSRLDGKGLRVTIIASRWYGKVVHSLTDACSEELLAKGVADEDLHLVEVSGAFELPYAAARVIHCKDSSHRPDAVICVGCLVKDGTHMCETMSQAVANGIMKLNTTSDTPVIFGVLCCETEGQAHSCAAKKASFGGGEGEKCNHGVAWAQSALEMAHLKRCVAGKKSEHCRCTRCENRSTGAGTKQESKSHQPQESLKTQGTCTTCGSSAGKCSCKDCKCKVCCDNRGDCASCGSSASNCSCEDCKCRACCSKREACRGCGCPPDKCSCQGCNCVACSSKKETSGMKMPTPSSEHASSKHETQPLLGGKQSERAQGGSSECASCGSPGGKCMCGLLH